MTNEELVLQIQQGHNEMMHQLWEQVKHFVFKVAYKWHVSFDGRNGVCLDDLHNTGYIALYAAAGSYDPEKEMTFIGWFALYLKKEFFELYGMRAHKADPLHDAVSLDMPIAGKDGKETALGELIADPAGEATLEAVENRIYKAQLRDALEKELCALPLRNADILRRRYYRGQTYQEISEDICIYPESVRQIEKRTLRAIRRHPQNARRLMELYEFDFYHGSGLSAYKRSGLSVQERYLINLEKAAQKWC